MIDDFQEIRAMNTGVRKTPSLAPPMRQPAAPAYFVRRAAMALGREQRTALMAGTDEVGGHQVIHLMAMNIETEFAKPVAASSQRIQRFQASIGFDHSFPERVSSQRINHGLAAK